MAIRINVNGQIQSPEEAVISVMDHGFLFGDSIYETLRTYNETPFLMEQHLDRCEYSAAGLALALPWSREKITAEILRTVKAAGNESTLVRLVVTRGEGPLDMHPDTTGRPNLVIYAVPHPIYPEKYYEEGVTVLLVQPGRSSWGGVDPTIKSGSRLANVLALAEARRQGAFETVMANGGGSLTEGTSSNFFIVKNGKLLTAKIDAGLLPGITRQVVLDLAREAGIPVEETTLSIQDLQESEEAFLTSTTKRVMPIRKIGSLSFDSPGPMSRQLLVAFDARVDEELASWVPPDRV